MYTGKGALLPVQCWTALLNMHSALQAETCGHASLKDTVTIGFVAPPFASTGPQPDKDWQVAFAL